MTILDRYYRLRSNYRRRARLIWPSPAEVQFIRLMGGIVVTLPVKSIRNRYPMAVVLYRGRILRRYGIHREVRIGRFYVDFCNHTKGIEIDGLAYHVDKIAEAKRTAYIAERGVVLMRIEARALKATPKAIKRSVKAFLKTA